MKIRRILSALLFGLGVSVVFIGALAVILPRLDNPQLQLFLHSFETPSRMTIVNTINAFLLFVLKNSWQTLSIGALCVVMGIVLLLHFAEPEKPIETPENCYQRPAEVEIPAVREEPNPFAVAEKEEPNPFGIDLLSYQRPLLEENRIDDTLPHLPSSFAGESIAIRMESGAQSPSGARTIMRTPQPIAEMSAPAEPILPDPVIPAEQVPYVSEPSPSLTPAPSRIRSTMGQHRQW